MLNCLPLPSIFWRHSTHALVDEGRAVAVELLALALALAEARRGC
jgi:hypothetical protein